MDNYGPQDDNETEILKDILREQLLKEYIIRSENNFFDIYINMFGISEGTSVSMLILRPEKNADYEEWEYLKNVIKGNIGADNILLCSVAADMLLTVISDQKTDMIAGLEKLQRMGIIDADITAAYAENKSMADLSQIYSKLIKCLDYRFYAKSEGFFINEALIEMYDGEAADLDFGAVERTLKCGDSDKANYLIFEIFRDIERIRPDPAAARTYCMELFVCIIRCCETEKIDKYMKGLSLLQEMGTLFEIKEYILNAANEIIESNLPSKSKNYSKLTRDTLEIIDKNISNENLTLSWIAGNVLYTNVDYLGKVFKRETGKNFSSYVMARRMEIAKSLIIADKKDKIYEVAEKVGYGSNSQYFSQVFKKYTGVSPVAYKESFKLAN